MSQTRWTILPQAPDTYLSGMELPAIVKQVLYNRNLHNEAEVVGFLSPDGAENAGTAAHDPLLLAGMPEAVGILQQAIADGQRIAVYGDYDADGVTSTVLLTETLKALGGRALPYIPHRVREGYGLNLGAIDKLIDEYDIELMITVDCGIRSRSEVAHARSRGIGVIVTDHHQPGEVLPEADAVINPKRVDSAYPFRELAGVGVAFKLAQGLLRATPAAERALTETSLLDLVALGTVADVVPLLGENRWLVKRGLVQINAATRPGMRALLDSARLKRGQVKAEGIGFVLGPRINAAGRLDSARDSYAILSTRSSAHARRLADSLGHKNQERQRLTAELVAMAEAQIGAPDQAAILIVSGQAYLAGVAGLVASRLTNRFYRPSIVVERGEAQSKASARSIPEFHITQALDQCADLLLRHGGHAEAAGFTIRNENWGAFERKMHVLAAEQLQGHDLAPEITIDAELEIEQANEATLAALQTLAPFGHMNAVPVFCSRGVKLAQTRQIKGKHLAMVVKSGHMRIPAIAFNKPEWIDRLPSSADIAFRLSYNTYQHSVQLQIEDMRAT